MTYSWLLYLIIGIFIAILFLNIYFRVKVMRIYRKLVQNRVDFDTAHIFNRKRMESEIYPKYPQFKDDIASFVNHIQRSVTIASILIVLITIAGIILKNG